MIIVIVAEKEERKDKREESREREREKERRMRMKEECKKKGREKERGLPCVGSKRLRVYVQNASVCTGKTRASVQHVCVLPVHTEAFLNVHTETF